MGDNVMRLMIVEKKYAYAEDDQATAVWLETFSFKCCVILCINK